jgi:hypothetical protein
MQGPPRAIKKSARRQLLPVRRSARRQPLPARRAARKSASIKAPAAVAHHPVPRWLIHRHRRHRSPRHRRHAPPHIRHRRHAPPHIRHRRRAPPRRHRRGPPRRRLRGRQPQPPSPSASRVNTAELCRAGFALPPGQFRSDGKSGHSVTSAAPPRAAVRTRPPARPGAVLVSKPIGRL